MTIKRFVIHMMESLCSIFDAIPDYEAGHWYRYGDWGCRWGICYTAVRLDEQWKTGVWQ